MAVDKRAERRRKVLGIVVTEYTQTAQPVSSKSIAENYSIGVSAATIRNDLAALEEEGLLTHPHTSAGRMPTDAGYRFFVQHLLEDSELPEAERTQIRTQFSLARRELDQWLRLSTSVLANASQSAALATAPRPTRSYFKHVELVGIHGTKVLLVLVLQAGNVKQQLLDLDEPVDQDELSRISNELNDKLRGADGATISQVYAELSPFARQVALLISDLIARMDHRLDGQIFRDGLSQILDAPEFAEGENIRRIVRILEERTLLEQVVGEYDNDRDIRVIISGEGRYAELQEISLVISRYGVADHATGVLGVVGPLRMSYGRTIGAVRYVAALMSDMVQDMYGP